MKLSLSSRNKERFHSNSNRANHFSYRHCYLDQTDNKLTRAQLWYTFPLMNLLLWYTFPFPLVYKWSCNIPSFCAKLYELLSMVRFLSTTPTQSYYPPTFLWTTVFYFTQCANETIVELWKIIYYRNIVELWKIIYYMIYKARKKVILKLPKESHIEIDVWLADR